MELKVLNLYLDLPEDISLKELRHWIIDKLSTYGDPLRWAITSISSEESSKPSKSLIIEAVVISNNSSEEEL